MDVLSNILGVIRPQIYHTGGFDLGAASCVRIPPSSGLKCYVVVLGRCWFATDDGDVLSELGENDCFLLPKSRGFRLSNSQAALDGLPEEFSDENCGTISAYNGGGSCLIVGTHFGFAGSEAAVLLEALPQMVEFTEAREKGSFRWSLELLAEELRVPQPGGVLVAQYLANLILVQALRVCLNRGQQGQRDWLAALSDHRVSRALSCMHEKPAYDWTVEELGRVVGMSRSAFARRFSELVGKTPLDYLTRWRMMLASERLIDTTLSVSEIARVLGYDSASAFTKAFRRIVRCTPREYRLSHVRDKYARRP